MRAIAVTDPITGSTPMLDTNTAGPKDQHQQMVSSQQQGRFSQCSHHQSMNTMLDYMQSPHKYAPSTSRSRHAPVGGNGNVSGNAHMAANYFPHQQDFVKLILDTVASNHM
ncbi:hypothetical protein H5410_041199 [Solanum commersonii]|uniref:Uncharacterized protein n=1 Tax=Solanum commersonii TaxID=4109 RepID=A0A9J5XSB6_SOLCO|nr:hypothetical protein H5410_041199 [Solanum commersonii]